MPSGRQHRGKVHVLRHSIHAVVAAHDGQVNPERYLDIRVAKPLRDHVQRNLLTISQCLAALCRREWAPARRFPVPGDSSSKSAHPMPSAMCLSVVRIDSATTLSRGDRLAGQFINSCTSSGCIRTVRARRLFDRRTSNVAGSPE